KHGFDITARDIFRFINERAQKNGISVVNDDILEKIAGGKSNFSKAIAASLLALIGLGKFMNDSQAYAAQSENSITNQTETIYHQIQNNTSKNNNENPSRVQDDFYTSVNQEWLKNTQIPTGKLLNSTFNQVDELNQKNILNILKELSLKEYRKGSPEQKLSDFYKSVIDLENREKEGINPIKKYMDLYEKAASTEELLESDLFAFKETGASNFLSVQVTTDDKNSDKNILEISSLNTYLPKHTIDSEQAYTAYTRFIKRILELSGENTEQAENDAINVAKLEKELSESSLEQNELYDVDKTYNTFSLEEINKLYPNLNVASILSNMGFINVDTVKISDTNKFSRAYEYFAKKDVNTLKLYAKTRILLTYYGCLSKDFRDAKEDLNKVLYGVEGQMPIEKQAAKIVSLLLPDDLGKIFVEKYFSENAKKDIENLISKIKSTYKNKIKNVSWLSEATKEKALKKLDTMKLKIGYPEHWDNTLQDADIKSYEDGGSYFSNTCEIVKKTKDKEIEELNKPANRKKWEMAAYTVNAYYNPQNNEIVFPAGILQSPFYDVNASEEQNMGGIGAVIAHEISHAFDSVGSKYDENGNAVNWWTDEERENFNKRCEKFICAYDGLEISNNIKSNGNLTLFENIADVGAISCMLDILSTKENADYQTFFRSWATIWRTLASRECTEQLNHFDVHSHGKIRTNRTLSNFEEFYKAFDIKEEDKMYVAPEQRVKLW
ncbi:MAG: M13 family metallopeptidase, partial [Clostridia bacterium]|nr:M13 family metallopeptidase [Clostridia bacterium]